MATLSIVLMGHEGHVQPRLYTYNTAQYSDCRSHIYGPK